MSKLCKKIRKLIALTLLIYLIAIFFGKKR